MRSILLIALCFVGVGCGGSNEAEIPENPVPPPAPETEMDNSANTAEDAGMQVD